MNWRKKSLKEVKEALSLIRENPERHGIPITEVIQLVSIEVESEDFQINPPKTFNELGKTFEQAFSAISMLGEIQFNVFTDQLKNVVHIGWYISPTVFEDVAFGELNDLTKEGNKVEFENYIIKKITNKRLGKIINSISNEYPERKCILEEIVDLHKKEKYFGAISLSYSQIDGICNDNFGIGFFDVDQKKNYGLKITDRLKFEKESINERIGRQLNEPKNEITNNSKEYSNVTKKSSFNRHLVIHGHSLNYGTKKNSIRALLLLDFVYWLSKNHRASKR